MRTENCLLDLERGRSLENLIGTISVGDRMMGTEDQLECVQGEGGDTEIVSIGTHLKSREVAWLVGRG